jgi:hemerythrin
MTFAEWSDDLSLGTEKIDNQHKELLCILNDLHDVYDTANRQSAAEACLMKMKNYMKVHFTDEEQFMKDIGYPEIQAQKEEHKAFTDKVSDYDIMQIMSYTPYQDMLSFLKEWFINHIIANDMKIADFLRQNK